MATTVHLPDELLAALDRRAEQLGTSRNRLIVRAVEASLRQQTAWPDELLRQLRAADPDHAGAVDDMMKNIRAKRRSKEPPKL